MFKCNSLQHVASLPSGWFLFIVSNEIQADLVIAFDLHTCKGCMVAMQFKMAVIHIGLL